MNYPQLVPQGCKAETALAPELPLEALHYLEHARVEKRLSGRTLVLYEQELGRLARYATGAQVPLLQLGSAQLRRCVAQLHADGRSGRTIALILSAWRGFFGWAVRQGVVLHDPTLGIRAPKAARPLPKALAVDEAVRLAQYRGDVAGQEVSREDAWLQVRDAALVEMLYSSGLRVAELVGLNVAASAAAQQQGRGWVDMQSGDVHVFGKGRKRRTVPVGQAALEALRAWLAVRGNMNGNMARMDMDADAAQALFIGRHGTRLTTQSVWQRLRQRGVRAGLAAPVHPHMLRHSFASHILQSSGDLRAVQELLGHAGIATTQVYTRLNFQHLARAYDQAHPRARRKPDVTGEMGGEKFNEEG